MTTAAWEEGRLSGQLFEDSHEVVQRQRLYDEVRAYSLRPRESAAFIRQIMEDYS